MKRRTFIQTVAAVFGTAAIAHRFEPELELVSDIIHVPRTGEYFGYGSPDEVFVKLAHENIQRRTYAVMKGLA